MTRTRHAIALLSLSVLISAGSHAFAQDEPETAEVVAAPEEPAGHYENGVFVPKGNTLAEVLEQRAANRTQADAAHRFQLEQEAARADYEKAKAAYEEELARVEAETRAIEERAAKVAAEHEAAMAKWREDVEACKAGDTSRCAPKQK